MRFLGWFRSKNRFAVEPFGGDIRPAVRGPGQIQASLVRLSVLRTILTTFIIVVALVVVGLAIRAPSIMDTQLFISDGSAFGCFVQDHDRE